MNSKLIYPKLSYRVNGVLFKVHNELGGYHKEKQYQNIFEEKLKIAGIKYEREKEFPISPEIIGNQVDFCIENKLLVELKAKRFLDKEDYYQMKRYLKAAKIRLGLLVNFRNRYLKPKRILN